MTDQRTDAPPITTAGLPAFCAEYGALAYALHEARSRLATLEAENARLKELGQALRAEHGPGQCRPAQSETDRGG